MMNVGFALASVGGAALAGLLIAQFGLATAFYLDAASFLVIAALLAASRNLPPVEVSHESFRERLRGGLRYAREHPTVRLLLLGQALALVLFTLIVPIEVIYAKESLGTTSAGYGVLLASWGAGIFVGSLIYLQIKHRFAVAAPRDRGDVRDRIAYLGLAVAGTLLVACLISVIGGIGNGVQWIAVMTALQEKTARDYQARISGMMESLGAAMPGVGLPPRRRRSSPSPHRAWRTRSPAAAWSLLAARSRCRCERGCRAPTRLGLRRPAICRSLALPRVTHRAPRARRQPPRALVPSAIGRSRNRPNTFGRMPPRALVATSCRRRPVGVPAAGSARRRFRNSWAVGGAGPRTSDSRH